VALLFLCGVALAVLAYRDLIIPLRVKLSKASHWPNGTKNWHRWDCWRRACA